MFRLTVLAATGVLATAVLSGCGPENADSSGSGGRSADSVSTSGSTSAQTSTTNASAASSAPSSTSAPQAPSGPAASSTSQSAAAPQQPTLGIKNMGRGFPNTRGFGDPRPAVIDNGGDPTGVVTGVTWATWGGEVADGEGTGSYVGPNQSVAMATQKQVLIRASDLTTCNGHPVYKRVVWWFPAEGETYQWALDHDVEGYNLCNGTLIPKSG